MDCEASTHDQIMEQLETNTRITKLFLKQMPIWDYLNEFNAQAEQLSHDIDVHMNKVRNDCNRADKLPTLSTTIIPGPPKKHGNKDIVKICKKDPQTGEIVITTQQDPTAVDTPSLRPVEDQTIHKSLELLEQRPKSGEEVYSFYKEKQPWVRCTIKQVFHKQSGNGLKTTTFRLRMEEHKKFIDVSKYCVARIQDHGNKLRVTKRVIAGPTNNDLRPGIIGQEPCDINKERYLVLMDDGSARYYRPDQVYPILYQSTLPWEDPRYLGDSNSNRKADLVNFFRNYPRRHLLHVSAGKEIHLMRNGMIVPAIVLEVDVDTMKLIYKDRTEEWVYRGSARICKRDDLISRLLVNSICVEKLFYKLPGHMKRYYEAGLTALGGDMRFVEDFGSKMVICGQTARKSTSANSQPKPTMQVNFSHKAVVDDRQSKPDLQELLDRHSDHKKCDPNCLIIEGVKTESSVEDIIDEFRDVSDLKVPLLLGWKRILVSTVAKGARPKFIYIYQAPCGRILRRVDYIRSYIQQTGSKLDVDYFTFDREVDLNRSASEHDAFLYDKNIAKDATSKPLENKFVSLLNQHNEEQLPIDYEYRAESFPHPMLEAKNFTFNTEFKSSCECDDDCTTKPSCVCHRLTEQAFGTTAHNRGIIDHKCQYKEKRLMTQVRKTMFKGWGVVTLDDIPAGAFISTYSAELLDDADLYGDCDMYFADLDYISVVEEQKLALSDEERSDEGVDVDDSDDSDCVDLNNGRRKKNKKTRLEPLISESSGSESPESDEVSVDDFMPNPARKERLAQDRYPKRNRARMVSNGNGTSKNNNQRPNNNESRPRTKRLHTLLGESSDYTLDARMQGNVGRFYNHSCDPNAFVQNVFIETHDLRFPVVAFFAKRPIEAMEEITWNYNYKMGSIEGRELKCTCGAPNCTGRIL